jgi:hypothetical protein
MQLSPTAWSTSSDGSIRRCILVAVLAVHSAMLAWGAYRDAPTIEEVSYLPAGLSHWQFGRFDLANVSPPLVRLIAALPVLCAHPHYDWHSYDPGMSGRADDSVGDDFVAANGSRTFWLFTLSRLACIPFSLLGALCCYLWACRLYGVRAGLLALTLWCFSPTILGRGQLMGPDLGVTAFCLAASFLFWRWLRNPTWRRCVGAGIVFGLAQLAKTNAIVLFPLWPVLWVTWLLGNWRACGHLSKQAAQLVTMLLLGTYIINLGYGFEGSLARLDSYRFQSTLMCADDSSGNRFAKTAVGRLLVPLPANYLLGVDAQKSDFENIDGNRKSYLRGRWYKRGWWWYYCYVLAVKETLGTWGIFIIAVTLRLRVLHRRYRDTRIASWRDELVLLAPGVTLFVLASSQTGFSHHLRYVVPALPFLGVWISQVASGRSLSGGINWIGGLTRFMVATAFASSIWAWPHSLAYFNELIGGPLRGGFHLQGSNIDWGEDLLYLKDWITAHPEARPLYVYYWGVVDPRIAGIDFPPLDFDVRKPQSAPGQAYQPHIRPPGWYIVSDKCLRGDRRFGPGNGAAFLSLTPVGRVGYSLIIYKIGSPHASNVTLAHRP